jgi:hypothetical protein
MSNELQFLKNLIASAQIPDNEAAVKLLRQICSKAVDAAPVADLITIGQCLMHVGRDAERIEAGRN